MSGYLEAYGEAEQNRAKRVRMIKIASVALVCAAIVGLILYAVFKNYSEERRAKAFLAELQKGDFQAAYQMWGCTAAHPCPNYRFEKFMEDWGPKSQHPPNASAHIGLSQSCGTGVLLRLDYPNAEPVPLWVERGTDIIGYAPWPECPGRHLHIGAWLRSLFGR